MQKVELEALVKNLMVSSDQNSSTQSQTTNEQRTSEFTDHERDVTGYLFAKLIVLYANSFYLVYPSDKEVRMAKREYAKQIGRFSREQVDTAIGLLARLAISHERENKIYREPNIPVILALMDEAVKRDRSHQLFLPEPPESKDEKQKRIQEGLKHTSALLAMFDEPQETKTLTEAEILDLDRLELISKKM